MIKTLLTVFVLLVIGVPMLAATSGRALAETRTLNILFVHTGEKASITFKRNGRYDANGLKQLSNIVRDWRRNQPTKMDPRLFDLVWEVYQRAGASGYINVVSGYRSPETNTMLRSRSKGVAKNSQHMMGKAMDFYIPGTPLKKLRELGVKLQAGGVGYYPTSGSPFVHMDVAGVRAWPRMSRQELSRLFPDGKTIHLPSDGKPLPGYQQAMAEYKKRLGAPDTLVASSGPAKKRNFFAALFGTGDEDEEEDVVTPAERPAVVNKPVVQETLVAAAEPPATEPVPAAAVESLPGVDMASIGAAPVPQVRPSFKPNDRSLAVALYSPARSAAEDALTQVAAGQPADDDVVPLPANIPVPTLLGPRGMKGDAEANVMTASLAPANLTAGDGALALIPVPANRPAVAEALLASADGQSEAEVDEVEQAILSPQAAEALDISQGRDDVAAAAVAVAPVAVAAAPAVVTVPADRPTTPVPTPAVLAKATPVAVPKAAPERYIQVAALTPVAKPSSRTVNFGDVFEEPVAVNTGIEEGLPAKGARPSPAEAALAHGAMSGGTKLTKNLLSEWALSRDHFENVKEPTKAPRIVSRSLAPAPSDVYMVGFSAGPTTIDPGRFGPPKAP